MQPTTTSTTKIDPMLTRERVFVGFYHFRSSRPHERVFYHMGDVKSAKDAFYEHCKIMNYRFISVRPFIVDLKSIEDSRNDGYDLNEQL